MRLPLLLLATAGLLAGCADRVSLMPAPSATTVPTSGEATAAVETVSGVRVKVISREWPGEANISEAVTPLKVEINNNSDKPVLIRYSEIRLVTPTGQAYAALPPFAIDENVSAPRLASGYYPITLPGFTATRFTVSPLYSPLYPGFPVAAGTFPHDPLYYGRYGNFWRSVELPTTAMTRLALPEGVLDPGGRMQGYLYFQQVDPDVAHLRFRMDLIQAGRGDEFGSIEIPFLVS